MIEFIGSLTAVHVSLLVSILALLLSLGSVIIAEKARRFAKQKETEAERIRVLEKRTEILSEIDKQNARFGALLMISAEKVLLLQRNPGAASGREPEYERLRQNLKAVENMRSKNEEQRQAYERIGADSKLAELEPILAEIRRLSIHFDEEVQKERRNLDDLRQAVGTREV